MTGRAVVAYLKHWFALVCSNPECDQWLDPERVRRRRATSCPGGACRTRTWELRHGQPRSRPLKRLERQRNGKKRSHGQRGVDLPYRRTHAVVTEFLAHTDVAALIADGADPAEIAKGLLYEPASPANRKRIDRLSAVRGGQG